MITMRSRVRNAQQTSQYRNFEHFILFKSLFITLLRQRKKNNQRSVTFNSHGSEKTKNGN